MHGEEFFRQALIYLGAAVLAVPVAQRLGLGSVLGYLLAGMAVGPFALGLIGDVTAASALGTALNKEKDAEAAEAQAVANATERRRTERILSVAMVRRGSGRLTSRKIGGATTAPQGKSSGACGCRAGTLL